MTSSRRNRLLIAAAGVVGVLIVALLIAPSFIDLNKYKPQILAEVKKATGRDLVIDGPASLSLLPLPSATVSGVKFFNVPGAKNPNMVEVKSITVRPSVLALLGGPEKLDYRHHLDSLGSIVRETGIAWHISSLDVERQGARVLLPEPLSG